ncbi:hypothetical protein D3C73_619870 [compost metagenome]
MTTKLLVTVPPMTFVSPVILPPLLLVKEPPVLVSDVIVPAFDDVPALVTFSASAPELLTNSAAADTSTSVTTKLLVSLPSSMVAVPVIVPSLTVSPSVICRSPSSVPELARLPPLIPTSEESLPPVEISMRPGLETLVPPAAERSASTCSVPPETSTLLTVVSVETVGAPEPIAALPVAPGAAGVQLAPLEKSLSELPVQVDCAEAAAGSSQATETMAVHSLRRRFAPAEIAGADIPTSRRAVQGEAPLMIC